MATRRQFIKVCGSAVLGAGMGVDRVWASTAKVTVPSVGLPFAHDGVTVVRRNDWAYVAPKPWRLRESSSFDRITVHHTGSTTYVETDRNAVAYALEGVLTAHLKRGFGDVGYHFIVDYAGRVWEGRSLAFEGAHVSAQNEGNIGVMLLGNFERQEPSAEQMATLGRVVTGLRETFTMKKHRLYGHRDLGQSCCPGRNLYPRVVSLRTND